MRAKKCEMEQGLKNCVRQLCKRSVLDEIKRENKEELSNLIKLAKYMKPFLSGLILAVVLLLTQALCELNLPNYMSDIVNIGIQQSGIEHAAPDALSEDGMKLITAFMTGGEKELVAQSYSLTASSDSNAAGKPYLSLYPNADAQIYVKKDIGEVESADIDAAFGTAAWTFINVMDDMSSQSGESGAESTESIRDIDLTTLYPMQPVFDNFPESVITAAHDKAAANDASMLKQSGIVFAKGFYGELGINILGIQTAYIMKIGFMMILIALLAGLATVLVSLLSSRIATGAARDLRKDVFNKIESFSSNEFDKFSAASLITRCTNDVTQIQQILTIGIRMVCFAPIMGVGGIIMAVSKSVSMSWILAVAVITIVGMLMIIMSIAMPRFKVIQVLVDKLNLVSRENLSGLMVIRAFGTQNHEKERFTEANEKLTETNLFINRVMSFMMPAMTIVMNGITLLIIWSGSHQIAASSMQVGDMMAFMQYAMQVLMSFMMISMMFIMIPRAAVSAVRIAEVLETELSIVDPKNPKKFMPDKKGLVEFKNVHFRYHNAEEDALCDISFTAYPGQTTAIIGSTGSGKSTVANLIMRFYDVSAGEVSVGGVDIREVSQADLRSKIGYVPQKGVLLSGTIAFNLKYGKKDAGDKDIEEAALIAQAIEFIEEKPEQFDSLISQGGANVSGGQRQRLSIARALAKQPEILIFDDSFSALDFKTDAALRKSLHEHTADSTVIIVAQRVNTIMNAEQIIVLESGKVVGRGTHKELLKNCNEYYEIASSQLSKEELA